MDSTFAATHAALDQYDAVDGPAVEALRRNRAGSVNLTGFVTARKSAADLVRAAYLHDTEDINTPENVELMSVERIRAAIGGTFLGRMLGLLP
jgi:hypothetical protein